MRTNNKPRLIEQPCSFDAFLSACGNPMPAFAGVPRTLRDHIGQRDLGDFGTVLMAERPVSDDLSAHVARWRASNAAHREDLLLRAHPDQTAEDRRLRFGVAVTTIVFSGWVIIGVIAAAFAGKL